MFQKEELFNTISKLYNIGTPISSRFVMNGLNDTYIVETNQGAFVLRIYKHQWRSESDIHYELDFLVHLHHHGIPVSTPIPRLDGGWLTELEAPEGLRYAVLFTFAHGKTKVDVQTSRIFGRSVALLHRAADEYMPLHSRFSLDAKHLLDEPVQHILPFLQHRSDDYALVQEVTRRLRGYLDALPEGLLDWGACHGDLHGWNVHYTDAEALTHFDLDCCGRGWRSYDLSVFLWCRVESRTKKEEFKDECWDAFLDAYMKERPLQEADLVAIPIFVAVRQLWLMGLHTGNSAIWGAWQDDSYFDRKLKFLNAWTKAYSL
ncbi:MULTISPECIES: phosphotransferase [unclassified Paenibacillus]|uniref:phosphotransferase n=1 Tax=unclassified Paenibacillus TaxID=185978 RepID=UPI00363D41A7